MSRDYIETMQRKENLCRAYLQKAEDAFQEQGAHNADEGRYLQEAVKLQYEMAEISDGEERKFHQRRQKEIEARLKEVIRVVSPETYSRMQSKAVQKNSGAEGNKAAAGTSSSGSKGQGAVSDEQVSNWFKESPMHSFEAVAGMNDLKAQLKECIHDTRLTQIREYMKMRQLHSFLFIGPPGCGKTYIIEAFAHELMEKDYKYMSVDGSDILSKYVGDAEKIIARLFEEAENNAPCIIFIDEIDGVCKNRSIRDLPVWASNMTTAFLTAYNRINSSDKPVIFIGATNYPTQVDSAMMDRVEVIRVPFPDAEARTHAFRLKFEKVVKLEEGYTYADMAACTDTYNYRDIERLCDSIKNLVLNDVLEMYGDETAAVDAMKSGSYVLTRELFDATQAGYTPSPKEAIIRELDAFEAAQKQQREQQG
ncbi:MAG: ATP-binding protein [Eubacterium sp.]|nr:ATP-binding protein [Eubacterium sp.]